MCTVNVGVPGEVCVTKDVHIRVQGFEALRKGLRASSLGKVGVEQVPLLRQQCLQDTVI